MKVEGKKQTFAEESPTVKRAREKAQNEIAQEKQQFNPENLKKITDIIHNQQARNKHEPVSPERFTNLTGQMPNLFPKQN